MKITNFALLFVAIAMVFVVKHYVYAEAEEAIALQELQLNQIVDRAVMDGAVALVERGDHNRILLNKDAAVEAFFQTLYGNLGARTDLQKERIHFYVPMVVVMDRDGFYLYSLKSYDHLGSSLLSHAWSEKLPYTWVQGDLVYGFSMDDLMTLYRISDGCVMEGDFSTLSGLSDFAFDSELAYKEKKQQVIVAAIEAQVNGIINSHREIAKGYGVTYDFHLPTIEGDTWNRSISDVGIMAFVQGIPLGIEGHFYNECALGGAMVKKATPYYVQARADGRLVYHREGCGLLSDWSWPVSSRQDGALEGAYPCEVCKP